MMKAAMLETPNRMQLCQAANEINGAIAEIIRSPARSVRLGNVHVLRAHGGAGFGCGCGDRPHGGTHRYGLNEVDAAFDTAKRSGTMKVAISND